MELKTAGKELKKTYKTRETWMPVSREIVAECAKAIREIHVYKNKQAKKRLIGIRKKIKQLEKVVEKHPKLRMLLSTPYQEWVELEVLVSFIENKPLPELDVPPEWYLLGVLDSIGEGKRVVLDLLLHGRNEDAKKLYDRLEEVYYQVEGYSFPKSLVPGLKAKQDAMKRVLEGVYQIIVRAEIK